MTGRLLIVGAGALGRELAALVRDAGGTVAGFLDDTPPDEIAARGVDLPAEVVGPIAGPDLRDVPTLLGVGMPWTREAVDAALRGAERSVAPAVVHPTAVVGPGVRLAEGVTVAAMSVLTTDVVVERQVLVNLACTIAHDVRIGAASALMPRVTVSGAVRIGAGVLVGTGATILEGIAIGDGARVGAGAVVMRDVPPGTTVFGVPARIVAGG